MGEVPEVTSVIVYSDNNASIVKVAYMTADELERTIAEWEME